MRAVRHGILGTSIVIATLVMGAGHAPVHASQAAAAKGMMVHLQVSGDLHYSETFSHAEDGGDAIPAQFSCVRFTHPNFPAKGKPLAYALSFNNPDVMAATSGVFVSFYYDPKKIAGQHVEGAVEFLAVPAKNVAFGPGGEGAYTVVIHLAPDLHSGTAVATNMRNLLGAGHVTIKLNWSCPAVFARPT